MGAELPENVQPATEDLAELPSTTAALDVLRLLIAVDTFPRGGLYAGYYATSAALRYEVVWLTVLREHVAKGGSECPIPPLDVAFAWFVHRQFPVSYANVTHRRCGRAFHPPREAAFAFSSGLSGPSGGEEWKAVAGDLPAWPPPAAGSDFDLAAAHTDWRPTLASQLAVCMSRFASLLHSWLRPHFLDALFLERARDRYGRFLALLAAHPGLTLVPTADIAFMWHTHLGLSGQYAAAAKAQALPGPLGGAGGGGEGAPCRPTYLDLEGAPLRVAYNSTARLYEQMYGEPYDCPDSAWLRPSARHPLASSASPLAFALRAFDEVPSAAAAAAAAGEAEAEVEVEGAGGPGGDGSPLGLQQQQRGEQQRGERSRRQSLLPLPLPSLHISPRGPFTRSQVVASFSFPLKRRPHPRAGGHALFAAWLASSAAADFFDRQTCRGLCFRGSWSIKLGTVERMVTPLVLLPYMCGLPDSSSHPFLTAVTQRRGVWRPALGPLAREEETAEAEAEAGERRSGGCEGAAGGRERSDGGVGGSNGYKGGSMPTPSGAPIPLAGAGAGPAGGVAYASTVSEDDVSPGGGGSTANPVQASASACAAVAKFAASASASATSSPTDGTAGMSSGGGKAEGSGKAGDGAGNDGGGGGGGGGGLYSGCGFQLGDAEDFLDDPALWGLTALMEAIAAQGGGGGCGGASGQWGQAPREDEEDEEGISASGANSGHSSRNPLRAGGGAAEGGLRRQLASGGGGGGDDAGSGSKGGESRHGDRAGVRYGGTAPLWDILQKPEYGKRARALFRHLWTEVGRRGPEYLQQDLQGRRGQGSR